MPNPATVLLDLDDVLVDFVGAACEVMGWNRSEVDRLRVSTQEWDLCRLMDVSQEEFWNRINAKGSEFWESLLWQPWWQELIATVDRAYPQWFIVSSPSRSLSCRIGKYAWIKKSFGEQFDRFILTGHKHLLAQPTSILIDDKTATVNKFRRYGGKAVLFPNASNALWPMSPNPVPYVTQQLAEIVNALQV